MKKDQHFFLANSNSSTLITVRYDLKPSYLKPHNRNLMSKSAKHVIFRLKLDSEHIAHHSKHSWSCNLYKQRHLSILHILTKRGRGQYLETSARGARNRPLLVLVLIVGRGFPHYKTFSSFTRHSCSDQNQPTTQLEFEFVQLGFQRKSRRGKKTISMNGGGSETATRDLNSGNLFIFCIFFPVYIYIYIYENLFNDDDALSLFEYYVNIIDQK